MKIFNNKKGVTLLEGLIALGLLAMVTTGTLGVMLSISRKASKPDIREEMILAVEKANSQLQAKALCGDEDPLAIKTHNIDCMLPPICDRNTSGLSEFTYDVKPGTPVNVSDHVVGHDVLTGGSSSLSKVKEITFNIKCNGYSL